MDDPFISGDNYETLRNASVDTILVGSYCRMYNGSRQGPNMAWVLKRIALLCVPVMWWMQSAYATDGEAGVLLGWMLGLLSGAISVFAILTIK